MVLDGWRAGMTLWLLQVQQSKCYNRIFVRELRIRLAVALDGAGTAAEHGLNCIELDFPPLIVRHEEKVNHVCILAELPKDEHHTDALQKRALRRCAWGQAHYKVSTLVVQLYVIGFQ